MGGEVVIPLTQKCCTEKSLGCCHSQ